MPVSRNRKNHKTKVKNYRNSVAQNRNNIKKWLSAVEELNKEIDPLANTLYVDGKTMTAQLPQTNEINPTEYE